MEDLNKENTRLLCKYRMAKLRNFDEHSRALDLEVVNYLFQRLLAMGEKVAPIAEGGTRLAVLIRLYVDCSPTDITLRKEKAEKGGPDELFKLLTLSS